MGTDCPLILMSAGEFADKYTSDALRSAMRRRIRSIVPIVAMVSFLVVNRVGRGAQSRSRSFRLVLARVCASTRLTITAQYRLWVPSALGRLPDTTTEPAGMRP